MSTGSLDLIRKRFREAIFRRVATSASSGRSLTFYGAIFKVTVFAGPGGMALTAYGQLQEVHEDGDSCLLAFEDGMQLYLYEAKFSEAEGDKDECWLSIGLGPTSFEFCTAGCGEF